MQTVCVVLMYWSEQLKAHKQAYTPWSIPKKDLFLCPSLRWWGCALQSGSILVLHLAFLHSNNAHPSYKNEWLLLNFHSLADYHFNISFAVIWYDVNELNDRCDILDVLWLERNLAIAVCCLLLLLLLLLVLGLLVFLFLIGSGSLGLFMREVIFFCFNWYTNCE